jgi:hypothetical protein
LLRRGYAASRWLNYQKVEPPTDTRRHASDRVVVIVDDHDGSRDQGRRQCSKKARTKNSGWINEIALFGASTPGSFYLIARFLSLFWLPNNKSGLLNQKKNRLARSKITGIQNFSPQ